MNRTIRVAAIAMAALMTCVTFLAVPASATDAVENAPCDQPGPVGVLAQSGYVTVPWWGYYWEGSSIRTAGSSHNAVVYKHNYDVAGRCVSGASTGVVNGPSNFCPPPGRAGALASQKAFVPEDTYWGADGNLYLRGYDQTTTAYGQNNAAGFSCAGTVTYGQGAPVRRDICLTCRGAINLDLDITTLA